MLPLTQEYLENCFNRAKEVGANYVAVKVTMPGAKGVELIINGKENFDYKLAYYKKTYNELLEHNHVAGLAIEGFTFGNTLAEVEKDLLG